MTMHRRQFLSYGALVPATGILVACGAKDSAREVASNKEKDYSSDSKVETGADVKTPSKPNVPETPKAPAEVKKEEVFTRAAPGKWAGKEATHAPTFSFSAGKLVITTAHVMEAAHFISSQQLRNRDGRLISEKTYKAGADAANPSSVHAVDLSLFPHFDVFSRCNLHGLWRSTGAVMDLEDVAKDRVLFTAEKPGKWAGKEMTHMPTAAVKEGSLVVETPHAMSAEHFISKHQIRSPKGELLGENSFDPLKTTGNPVSEFSLQILEDHPEVLVYSFCNLHGVWKADFKKAA